MKNEIQQNWQTEPATFIDNQPKERVCIKHPDIKCPLDIEKTKAVAALGRQMHRETKAIVCYKDCPMCMAEKEEAERIRKQQEEIQKLKDFGVSSIHLDASLENWNGNREVVDRLNEFCRIKRGFVVLSGNTGTGKTHLAIGCARQFHHFWITKHNSLLRQLRDSYNGKAPDPIPVAKSTGLFVLDEFGVCGGGKDEFPMLYEIFDHRHCEQKPTIITSNLSMEEIREALTPRLADQVHEPRLADRLNESLFAAITLTGPSHRKAKRDTYFS